VHHIDSLLFVRRDVCLLYQALDRALKFVGLVDDDDVPFILELVIDAPALGKIVACSKKPLWVQRIVIFTYDMVFGVVRKLISRVFENFVIVCCIAI